MRLSLFYDGYFTDQTGYQDGQRRVYERQRALEELTEEPQFFPIPSSFPMHGRVVFQDESGYPFLLRNGAGQDTALVVSQCSYVVVPPGASQNKFIFGPLIPTIFYAGPISRHVSDLKSI